jgi:thiamine biosynthesis protein ThiS
MASEPAAIRVHVNDEAHDVPAGTALLALLQQLDEPYKVAVVEHNGAYVSKPDLGAVVLADGDRVEVILPAFGG